jgi:hypothetical protein
MPDSISRRDLGRLPRPSRRVSNEWTRTAGVAGLVLWLTLPLSFVVIGCARDVPSSTLPAPEYERPTSESWPAYPDAGKREVDEQGHTAGPVESGAVRGELNGSLPATKEESEKPPAPANRSIAGPD